MNLDFLLHSATTPLYKIFSIEAIICNYSTRKYDSTQLPKQVKNKSLRGGCGDVLFVICQTFYKVIKQNSLGK